MYEREKRREEGGGVGVGGREGRAEREGRGEAERGAGD